MMISCAPLFSIFLLLSPFLLISAIVAIIQVWSRILHFLFPMFFQFSANYIMGIHQPKSKWMHQFWSQMVRVDAPLIHGLDMMFARHIFRIFRLFY